MAITNPNLLKGFDKNNTNVTTPSTGLQDDGYITTEVPKGSDINFMFNDFYKNLNHIKETGIYQYDATISYDEEARTIRDGTEYRSIQPANQGNDPLIFPLFWEDVIKAGITVASTAEAQAGTNNDNLITPLRLREAFNASGTAPVFATRAWVNFNGTGVVAIRASGNVSSITDLGIGKYRINFIADIDDSNFSTSIATKSNDDNSGAFTGHIPNSYAESTSFIDVDSVFTSSGTDVFFDSVTVSVEITR